MNWYLMAFQRTMDFSGRSRRKEFWMFFLFNFVISLLLAIVDRMMGTAAAESGVGILSGIYSLLVLLPSLSLSIRRLHDTGRSGWWILISLVPIIGPIVYIVFAATEGDAGTNQFGPSPKAGAMNYATA
ncbi:MAG: DUF805 domain-containing protein [Caldilineaceae bacterium]